MNLTQPVWSSGGLALPSDVETFLLSVFARCIRTEQGCLLWRGYVDKKTGYSHIGYAGHQTSELGHRLVFRLAIRPLDDSEHVDHRCHNADTFCAGNATCLHRRCLEPTHLEGISQAENNRRAAEHARRTPGARWTNEMRGTCKSGLHPWIPENIKQTERQLLCIPCDRARKQAYEQRVAARAAQASGA